MIRCRSDSTAKAEEEGDGERGAAWSKKSTSGESAVSPRLLGWSSLSVFLKSRRGFRRRRRQKAAGK